MSRSIPVLGKEQMKKPGRPSSHAMDIMQNDVEEIFRDRRIPRNTAIDSNAKPIQQDRRDDLSSSSAEAWYLKVRYAKEGLR